MKLLDKLTYRFGIDKITHCSVGANITFMVILAWWIFDWKHFSFTDLLCTLLLSGIMVLAVGVCKELLDDHFDFLDLKWTMIGWFLACLCVFILLILVVALYNL